MILVTPELDVPLPFSLTTEEAKDLHQRAQAAFCGAQVGGVDGFAAHGAQGLSACLASGAQRFPGPGRDAILAAGHLAHKARLLHALPNDRYGELDDTHRRRPNSLHRPRQCLRRPRE